MGRKRKLIATSKGNFLFEAIRIQLYDLINDFGGVYRVTDESMQILESQGLAEIIDGSILEIENQYFRRLYKNRDEPNLDRSIIFKESLEAYIEKNKKLKSIVEVAEANVVLRPGATIRDLLWIYAYNSYLDWHSAVLKKDKGINPASN